MFEFDEIKCHNLIKFGHNDMLAFPASKDDYTNIIVLTQVRIFCYD